MPLVASETELAWLAGLLEGEGSFMMISQTRLAGGVYRYPIVTVNMTDQDIIERVAAVFEVSVYSLPKAKNFPNRKQQWRACVTGQRAADFMVALRPWMGIRRTAKIDEIIAEHESREPAYVRRIQACRAASASRGRDATTGQFAYKLDVNHDAGDPRRMGGRKVESRAC